MSRSTQGHDLYKPRRARAPNATLNPEKLIFKGFYHIYGHDGHLGHVT